VVYDPQPHIVPVLERAYSVQESLLFCVSVLLFCNAHWYPNESPKAKAGDAIVAISTTTRTLTMRSIYCFTSLQ
jgi:hypothetical protein